jgi:hypothetical protein
MEQVEGLVGLLNNNTGSLMVLLTFIYVVCTMLMLRQFKEQTWLTNRAYVVVRLAFRQKMELVLELANEGRSPAQALKLRLDRDLYQFGDTKKRINDMPLFAETFRTVPPGGTYFLFLWPGMVSLGSELYPKEFKVTANYQTLGRRIEEETTLHPLLYAEYPPLSREESLEKLAGIAEETKKTLEKVVFRFDQFLRYGK